MRADIVPGGTFPDYELSDPDLTPSLIGAHASDGTASD
jgi:hypothetical protein